MNSHNSLWLAMSLWSEPVVGQTILDYSYTHTELFIYPEAAIHSHGTGSCIRKKEGGGGGGGGGEELRAAVSIHLH